MGGKERKEKYLDFRVKCFLGALLILTASMAVTVFAAAPPGPMKGAVIIFAVIFLLLFWAGYTWIYVPYRETGAVLGELSAGSLSQDLQRIKDPYSREMARAIDQISYYARQASALEASKRQAQYQALQNQINPHFLYNTLESIRSEAVIYGLDSVDAMCEALANYFRYTISNMENVVTVRDELENIRNYFTIQQYRFEDRLKLTVEEGEDTEALDCLLPKLTLQPIVENAIIHGLERRIGTGTVTVRLIMTESRLLIQVSDDGLGMDEETLERINHDIAANISGTGSRGGIAIGNVNNRIQLLFGEEYGVIVYSAKDAGTDVEISLPRTTLFDLERYRGSSEPSSSEAGAGHKAVQKGIVKSTS